MLFRTTLPPYKSSFQLSYQDSFLSIGSCFAENMSKKLTTSWFAIAANPQGILYNPISISNCVNNVLSQKMFSANDIFEARGLWHSFEHHSCFSKMTAEETVNGINTALENAHKKTKQRKKNVLLLTLGTAFVFIEKISGNVVANCHKLPAAIFDKKRLEVQVVVETLEVVLAPLKDWKIILTVSPVRHLKEGFVENQKSKAILLLAIEQLCKQYNNINYFPAYELMIDDLRDYRFYEADMLHPSDMAIEYIWQFFCAIFFDETTKNILREVEKINAAAQHRPFQPNTAQHQDFLKQHSEKIKNLVNRYPFLEKPT